MFLELKHSCQVHKLMLNQSAITIYMLVKPWNSKWLKSITNTVTLLFHTRLLLKLSWNFRKKKLLQNLKKDRYLKEQLRILLITAVSYKHIRANETKEK